MTNTPEYVTARDLGSEHLDRVISVMNPRRGFSLQGLISRVAHQRGTEVEVSIQLGPDVITYYFDPAAQITLLRDPEFTS